MIDYDELEKLITLAEEVSTKVTTLNDRIGQLGRALFFVGLTGILPAFMTAYLWFSNYISGNLLILTVCFSSVSFIASMWLQVVGTRKIRKMEHSREMESEILSDLLSMVYEYRTYIYDADKSKPINNALIDMRLKRLEYSGKW